MTGKQFKQHRRALRLTQKQLATALGLTPNSVARLERGERKIGGPVAKLLTLLIQLHNQHRRT